MLSIIKQKEGFMLKYLKLLVLISIFPLSSHATHVSKYCWDDADCKDGYVCNNIPTIIRNGVCVKDQQSYVESYEINNFHKSEIGRTCDDRGFRYRWFFYPNRWTCYDDKTGWPADDNACRCSKPINYK